MKPNQGALSRKKDDNSTEQEESSLRQQSAFVCSSSSLTSGFLASFPSKVEMPMKSKREAAAVFAKCDRRLMLKESRKGSLCVTKAAAEKKQQDVQSCLQVVI